MVENKTRIPQEEPLSLKMTCGCAYLTPAEANLLRIRGKNNRKNISSTIQEIVQPVIDRFESASEEVRNIMLNGYTDQSRNDIELGLKTFQESGAPAFEEVHWVLPIAFIDRLNSIVAKRNIEGYWLMSHILSDTINIRDSSK